MQESEIRAQQAPGEPSQRTSPEVTPPQESEEEMALRHRRQAYHGNSVPGSRDERNSLKRQPVLETLTPIPEGLDAPGAGARNVDAWLRRTFNMTLEEATRTTGHSTLRQIVAQLDAIASGEGGYAPEGEGGSAGTPITAEEAQALPPAQDGPPSAAPGEGVVLPGASVIGNFEHSAEPPSAAPGEEAPRGRWPFQRS